MRKLILFACLVVASSALFAQNFDEIQERINKGKYDEAKEKLDKMSNDTKAQGKSDYWFLKAKIYNNLAKPNNDSALRAEAFVAMKRYFEMEAGVKEESKRHVKSILENHQTAFALYSDYANAGIKEYQEKRWSSAYYDFIQSLEAFDYLSKNKFTNATFDTTMILYAGIAAQNAGAKDNAAKYYAKIADANIADSNYVELYEFLVSYYNEKKDTENFNKYLALGKALYPKRSTWLNFELQNLGTDKASRLAGFQKLLQNDPNNHDLLVDYAVELFNFTYGKDKPTDYTQRQGELTTALQNAIQSKPNGTYANYIMTQHLSNQMYDMDLEYNAMKGTKPEDVKKKQELKKGIDAKSEELYKYSYASFQLYEQMTDLKASDKANFRNITNQLIDYHRTKKQPEKVKFYEDKLKAMK